VIEEIEMASDNTRDLLVRIDERTEQTQKDVDLLKHVILEGNGTPALTVQVATLNTRLSSIEDGVPAMTVQVATLDTRLRAMEESKRESSIPRHVTVGLLVSIILAGFGIVAGFMQ
jgi:hypothetical protein